MLKTHGEGARTGPALAAETEPLARTWKKTLEMLDTPNTQYDSFLFWRQPIPELDLSELEGLGLINGPSIKDNSQAERQQKSLDWAESEEEAELSEYNSFNYWREPIASIDLLDFNLLL
ncbi:hypothetical protein GJAV_G00103950 [Gymnothorax javanicus]|nr:hypothetical protein GJAV_G00103950 [Gymnothorax javanicus]